MGGAIDKMSSLAAVEEEISVAAGLKSAALAFLEKMQPRMWSAITLAALYAVVVPIMIVFVGCAKLVKVCFGSRDPPVPFNGKVAIVTGGKMTKAFVICRQLKQQGCRVVLVETSKYWMVASRFSKSVDRFVTVPVPEREPRAYYKAIRTLALEEKATLFVPVCSPVASHYDSRVADVLPHSCFSWACSPQITDELDDKVAFCRSAAEMGLSSPITQYMTSKQQVVRFNEAIRASGATSASSSRASITIRCVAWTSSRCHVRQRSSTPTSLASRKFPRRSSGACRRSSRALSTPRAASPRMASCSLSLITWRPSRASRTSTRTRLQSVSGSPRTARSVTCLALFASISSSMTRACRTPWSATRASLQT